MRYWLVMPAAGAGRRFGDVLPKQYVELCGRSVLEWALAPFLEDPRCAGMVLALAPDDPHWSQIEHRLSSVRTAPGGQERSHSVRNALQALDSLAQAEDWVLVHDAARPCLPRKDLDTLLVRLAEHAVGGLLAAPASDTLKRSASDLRVQQTVDRTGLWRAMTPQMFRYRALCQALDSAIAHDRLPTDEAQAMEWAGFEPVLVEGSTHNIKITQPEDLALAEAMLRARATETFGAQSNEAEPYERAPDGTGLRKTEPDEAARSDARLRKAGSGEVARGEAGFNAAGPGEMRLSEKRPLDVGRGAAMRVGSGIDVHAFGPGEFVMLGGVRVPHSQGVVAHSDGDVILHALCDALLGAAGLGDIGQHFRDDDPQWRGADSKRFVTAVMGMLKERGLSVMNADVTVLAEAPRLSKYRAEMRRTLAELLEVDETYVNVKATTTERLGFIGRSEGLAAQATVALTSAAGAT